MPRHIAFLRGINVSGARLIKMDALKIMFEELKFKNVKTYIQSGNVLFDVKETDESILIKKIEKHLHKSLGYEVAVIVRTLGQVAQAVAQNPFPKAVIGDDLQLYVSFLPQLPESNQSALLLASESEHEKFVIINREVYCLCSKKPDGTRLFSNTLVEKKLKLPATTRNWATVNKVLTL